MAQGALPGFRDFYPAEFAQRAYITRVWREVAHRYAFVEYDGPPLEPLELYTKKSGDEMNGDIEGPFETDQVAPPSAVVQTYSAPSMALLVATQARRVSIA